MVCKWWAIMAEEHSARQQGQRSPVINRTGTTVAASGCKWLERQARLSKTPLFETAQPSATGPGSRAEESGSAGGVWSFKNPKSTFETPLRSSCRKGAFRKTRFRPDIRGGSETTFWTAPNGVGRKAPHDQTGYDGGHLLGVGFNDAAPARTTLAPRHHWGSVQLWA
jgi:hypothetical protein